MYQLLRNSQFYQKYITFSADLDVTTASPILLECITSSPQSYHILNISSRRIINSFVYWFKYIGVPYKENTIQNHDVIEVKEHNEIPEMEKRLLGER